MDKPKNEGTPSVALSPSRGGVDSSRKHFTFNTKLLRKLPSQVELAYSEVQAVILDLEECARDYSSKFGVRFGPVELNVPKPTGELGHDISVALRALYSRITMFSLDRIAGQWGIWHVPVWRGVAQNAVPLRDAPIEARILFLKHSFEFFTRYLAAVEEQLEAPKAAVDLGRETLELLGSIEERK